MNDNLIKRSEYHVKRDTVKTNKKWDIFKFN